MCRERAISGIALALGLSVLLPSARAFGDESRLVASLALKEEYNDNLLFSTDRRTDSFVSSAAPGLDFTRRTERLDARLALGAIGSSYTKDRNLDAIDQNYRGKLGYWFTPALRLSGDGGFRRDTRPDREIETTGLFETLRSDRWNASAGAEWAVTETTAVNATYGYEKTTYSGDTRLDFETHSASLVFIHDLGKRLRETKGRAVFGFARTGYTGFHVENYTGALGVSRGLSETWSVLADVGGRYTRTTFDSPMEALTSGTGGWIANVSAAYKGEQTRGSLSFYHDVTAASGREGASERTAAVIDASRQETAHFGWFVGGGYYLNRSNPGQYSLVEIDEQTVRVRPGVRVEFTRDIVGEAAYQFTRVLFGQTDTAARQNLVYCRVTLKLTLYE